MRAEGLINAMSNGRTGAATVRPPGTVRFSDASLPSDNRPTSRRSVRPYEVPERDTKARNRRLKQIQWVVRDFQSDGTCLPPKDSTDNGWRTLYIDDLIARLPECPLLCVNTFGESLTFKTTRYTNEQPNADWKRAVVIALDFLMKCFPTALYRKSD